MTSVSINYVITDAEKRKLAAEFLRNPGEPLKAALAVFGPKEMGKCSWVALALPDDLEILSYQAEITKSRGNLGDLLPTKEALAMRVWQWTKDGVDIDSKIKAAKLLAEVMDWIPKPGTSVQVNVNSTVMEVPVSTSTEEWEKTLRDQQAKSKAEVLETVH